MWLFRCKTVSQPGKWIPAIHNIGVVHDLLRAQPTSNAEGADAGCADLREKEDLGTHQSRHEKEDQNAR